MRFTCTVEINAARDRVVELWQDPNNLKHWQDGYIKSEEIAGVAGTVGAETMMHYTIRNQPMELKETILENDLPKRFKGQYDHKHMSNTMENVFTELEENKTRWDAHIDYIIMHGFLLKVLSRLFPGMFKKQTQKWLDKFKQFVEHQEV